MEELDGCSPPPRHHRVDAQVHVPVRGELVVSYRQAVERGEELGKILRRRCAHVWLDDLTSVDGQWGDGAVLEIHRLAGIDGIHVLTRNGSRGVSLDRRPRIQRSSGTDIVAGVIGLLVPGAGIGTALGGGWRALQIRRAWRGVQRGGCRRV